MIKWKPELATGIAKIDEQHMKLIEISARTYALAKNKDEVDHYDDIVKLLEELKDYTHYHFAYEEALLEKFGYAKLEDHKMEHYLFLKRIAKANLSKIDQDQTASVLKILNMLVDWISSHIMETDKQYVELMKANGM